MTEITLRAYIREIDNLIEQEKLDEAIAHCRHLLQRHPKYIECYRLLGKAYLEAKRFGDAADIFQRVLSAVPDDFVSHIGMSIVREDEGNLDSAIWHMERAFETNPANPAIQQELKRLIGRRDGFEPHKVRLTRGALARMYAHGELFPQAIAELQSALDEHSDRPDLQVLLARLLWQTEQRAEATEVSGELLEILPFCMQATRIMAAELQQRGKADEATAYHRRLAQLDPYMAYTEAPMADPVRVDADSIMVQKLVWQPGQPLPSAEPAPADWAASLGLNQDEETGPGTGPLPSWLHDVEPSAQPTEAGTASALPFEGSAEPDELTEDADQEAPEPVEEPDAELDMPPDEADIPDWMQEAGWQESSGDVTEQPVSFSAEELSQLERGELPAEEPAESEQSGDLEPAEIPSWMQGMAPADDDEEGEGDEELEAILRAEGGPEPGAGITPESDELEISDQADKDAAQDVPGWLDDGEPGATSTIMTWLGDRDDEEEPQAQAAGESTAEEELPAPEGAEEEDVPSWLSGVAEAAADSESNEQQELAELRQQASRTQDEIDEPEFESAESGEVPGWLQSITGSAEEPEEVSDEELQELSDEADLPWEAEVEAAEQDTIPQQEDSDQAEEAGWLGGMEVEGQPETESPDAEEHATEEAEEDWLADLGGEPAAEEELAEEASWLEELSGEAETELEAEADSAVPGWMEGLGEEESADDEVEARASSWLDDLSDTLAETPAEPAEEAEESAPDWLDEMRPQEKAEVVPEAAEADISSDDDDDEDLGWLDDLEQAEAPEPTTSQQLPPAADLDDIDEEGVFDWLDQMAAQQDQEQDTSDAEPAEMEREGQPELSDEAPPETIDEGLDWLDRLSQTRGIDADVEREPAAGTISGRIGRDQAEEPSETEPADAEVPEPGQWEPEALEEAEAAEEGESVPDTSMADEEVPDWLRDQAEGESTAAEDTPARFEAADAGQEPTATELPSEQLEDEAPDWLMAAAETEGPGPEASEPKAQVAPEPDEPAADWLQEQAESAEAEPSEAAEEAPEWLDQVAEEPEPTPPARAEVPIADPLPSGELKADQPGLDSEGQEELIDEEVPDWLKAQAEEDEPEPIEASTPVEPELAASPSEQVQLEPETSAADIEPEPEAEITTEPAETAAVEAPPKSDELTAARQALADNMEQQAAELLQPLIKDRRQLEGIVEMLEAHLDDEPDAPLLWQVLGDAYMRLNRTNKAVSAYDRGMEESEVFDSARQALASADYERAAAQYGMLIKNKRRIEIVIGDLEKAVQGEKADPRIWQILGDAYMKADRVDESIEAYRKGMDSV